MPTQESSSSSVSSIESELYFLIARFLSSGPCSRASEVLLGELKEHKLLPKRIDWEGREHYRSYPDLIEVYRHISSQHLLNICQRLGPLLDKEVPPSISGVPSLLGAGSLSLLRTVETSKKTTWSPSQLAVLHHSEPLQPPRNIANIALCHLTKGREMSGRCRQDLLCAYQQYSHVSLHDRKLGHLSAVYCVSFDRTGQYIVTGADDHLVKIWSAASGRLLATMRGHSAEITDLAINYENTLLAAGSCDKIIRVWCLRTKAPVAVLHGHTGMITSVQFCPQVKGETRYLGTTGADGCVCFWQWNVSTLKFNLKPIKFVERSRAGAQMLCSSFSPGGLFLATGNSDNVIRVYFFHATCPEKICELEAHKDRVDSITYSNLGMRFVSGSKDGTARIWRYERQEWKALVLNMATRLQDKAANPSDPASSEEKKDKLRVTMVAWTVEDEQVITAVSDYSLKVWDSHTGKLVQVLQSHQDEVFVLEGSPINSRILLSAGHDGNVIIWDIQTGTKIKSFFNMIEGQGHGAVFDCKFSPDGLSFSAVDSHGHLLMFGFGSNEKFQKVPKEVFFHTDYRPLVRDANNYVLDEQTQQAPHLMPPPFLVDIDGNPYPPPLQRLVPGREKCKDMMLIPEVAVNEEGSSEVIGEGEVAEQAMEGEPAPIERMRPSLDAMIVRLQREQDHRIALEGGEPLASPPPGGSPPPFVSPRSSRNNQGRIGMRRSGETEGVRQSLGNVSLRATKSDIAALKRRVVVRPLDIEVLWRGEERRMAFAEEELKKFVFERKKKPNSPHGTSHSNASKSKGKKAPPANAATVDNEETARNRLITRALYDTEDEEEEEGNSSGSDFMHDSDSDEYSDWMGDTGSNLQPPKRTSQRQRKRKRLTSSEDDNDDQDEDDDVDIEGDNDSKDPDSGSNGEERRSKRNKPPPKKKKKPTKERSPKLPMEPAELLEMFRPPEWLTDTIPRKAPFVPQMGDEVMYFRQGHEAYLNAVKRHKVYEINTSNNQPWHKMPNLREQELVKIVGIKYEIRPPRLCCLKLAFIDHENGKMTGGSFSIKYHDMPDVIDFLVLRQTYNTAMRRKWKPDDRFRAMIDDHWWMGTIVSQEPFQAEFTDSMYQCFNVHWDNEEFEKLSPWDLEPITDDTVPNDIGGGIQVEKEELKSLLYTPTSSEWPPGGRDEECSRLVHGLEILMEHSMAEPFNAPVDLNLFPDYARVIEYPVDLSTIKARLENHFYRRVTAVQFDVRHIATNTSKFNEPNSAIVQKAAIITDTLLKFISEVEETDLMPMLTELMETEKLANNVSDSSDSTDDTSSAGKRKKTERGKSGKRVCREKPADPDMWKRTCHELVMRILECEDSEPFRTPVDPELYQDYYNIVEKPMDLSQVKEKLETQSYLTPLDLVRDVRLIFSNSKSYNTNKRSRIYAMTLRLSAMFDDQIRDIITEWKSASKKPSLPKLSTRSSTKGNCAATSTTSRERTTALTSDNSTPSTSSSQGRLRVTRSKGGATDHGSADGYSSGPSVPSRPRRSATATRYTGGKVMGSDGESAEEDDSDTEDLEMDQETEQVLVEEEEEEEETEKEEEEEVNRRRSKRKPPPRRVAESEDEEEDEDDDDGDDDDDDDDDDTEDESGKKIRTRGKMIPKRNSRSTGKISNGHSKPSYRTRASTGKTKQTKYVNYESSSMVSKSNSSSSASPGQTTGSGDNGSSSSSSSNESEVEAEEDKEQHSDYAEPRSSRRASTKQQPPRSIQKQVEIVRHSARERRKVQDNMFVYEQQRKSRIKTRNQGRRTVQYQEDESDNEKGSRRSEGRSARRNDIVENNSDSDSESASDSNSNETRSSTDTLTMSSRGRVRKLTPRARASLFGD